MQFFQRFSSGSPNSRNSSSRGVFDVRQHDGRLARQQTDHALGRELVGDALAEDAVDPALEDRRRLAPPVRMHDDIAVGLGQFAAMAGDDRVGRGALGDFAVGQDGIEGFLIEVVKDDLMAGGAELFGRRCGDGVAKTARPLMSENREDFHRGGYLISQLTPPEAGR